MIDTCPHCNRKLMMLTSPVCNWCGQRIEDKRFQAQARAHRLTSPLYGEQSQFVEDLPPENQPRLLQVLPAGATPGSTIRVITQREQSTYEQLREQALVVRPDGVVDELGAFEPYGAAMEITTPEGTSMLVAMADGSVSLYHGAGGGITGGGNQPKVRRAGVAFFDACRMSTHMMKITNAHPTPGAGRVRFYVMAPSASYTRETAEVELVEGRSPLAPLFEAGSRTLTELKLLSERAE